MLLKGVEEVSMGRRVRGGTGAAIRNSCGGVVDEWACAVGADGACRDIGLKPVEDESERRVFRKPRIRIDHQ